MNVQMEIVPSDAGATAAVAVTVDGRPVASRQETGGRCLDLALRFGLEVSRRLLQDPGCHIVEIPRSGWQHGGRSGESVLLDPGSRRLCALGWACLSLGVDREHLKGTDTLNSLQRKLLQAGRPMPERLVPLLEDIETQNALLGANDGTGRGDTFGAEPVRIATSLAEKQIVRAGEDCRLGFVFTEERE